MHPEDHKRVVLIAHTVFWSLTGFEILALYHYASQRDVMTAGTMVAYLCKDGFERIAQRFGG